MVYYPHHFVPPDDVPDLTRQDAELLVSLVLSRAPDVYVEVGVGHLGTMTAVMGAAVAAGVPSAGIGIDAFGKLPRDENGENSHEGDVIDLAAAHRHLEERGLADRCTLVEGDSSRILSRVLPGIADRSKLVLIDANHTYAGCLADYRAVRPALRPGDVVVFDDALPDLHEDYGRGPHGVIVDHVRGDTQLREFRPSVVMEAGPISLLAIFEVVGNS